MTVEVNIVRLEHERAWSLEAVNDAGTSIVWDALFPRDQATCGKFLRAVAEEEVRTFLDKGNMIPFRR